MRYAYRVAADPRLLGRAPDQNTSLSPRMLHGAACARHHPWRADPLRPIHSGVDAGPPSSRALSRAPERPHSRMPGEHPRSSGGVNTPDWNDDGSRRHRTRQRRSPVPVRHQRSSKVIRDHQRSSEVIRGHQWSSAVISSEQRTAPRRARASTCPCSAGSRSPSLPHMGARQTPGSHCLAPVDGGDQRRSTAISGHQWPSAALSGPQRSSVIINQRSSP